MGEKLTNLEERTILLCVTGGIAAYKAVDLASRLVKSGVSVRVAMTENACKLVGPKSFEAITGHTVFTDMWSLLTDHKIAHISIREESEAVVVAPATANIIAKLANGICDDLVSTTLCACWQKPMLIAPAMNNMMWINPAVQQNIRTVQSMGVRTVGPETGRLACGADDVGRMSEPEQIIDVLNQMLSEKQT